MRIVKTPQTPSRKVSMKRLGLGWPGACHSAWLLHSNQAVSLAVLSMSTPSSSKKDRSALTLDGSASSQQGWESVRPGTEPNSSNGQTKTDCNRSNVPNLGPEDWAHALQKLEGLQVSMWLQNASNHLKLPETHWLFLGPTPQQFASTKPIIQEKKLASSINMLGRLS